MEKYERMFNTESVKHKTSNLLQNKDLLYWVTWEPWLNMSEYLQLGYDFNLVPCLVSFYFTSYLLCLASIVLTNSFASVTFSGVALLRNGLHDSIVSSNVTSPK